MNKFFTLANLVRFIAVSFLFAFFAAAASAQCDKEAEATLYQKFLDNYKGTSEQQKTANDLGKDYVAKFGECPGYEEKNVTAFVQKWLEKYKDAVVKYQAALIENNCKNAVNNTPAKAFELCQPLLAKDPESLKTHLLLTVASMKNSSSKDEKSSEQAVQEARKVLDLIAAGKTVDAWIIADNKDEAVGLLQFSSGSLLVDSNPADAIAALTKAAQSASSYSKNPSTYVQLGRAIYNDQVRKQSDEYDVKCANANPSADCPAMLGQLYRGLDRVIDAYARSVALSRTNPEYKKIADSVNPVLTSYYKKRHDDSDAGLDQFVSGVLSMPLP
jgi:hypothetical protein